MASPARSLTQWLDELVAASPAERRMISIEGLDAGIALAKVRCDRHKVTLNWLSAYAHLDRTEASHRLHHGQDAQLHERGDLRPALIAEVKSKPTGPWPVEECPRCDAWIVWSTTSSGKPMPVNAYPDPTGSIVLCTNPDPDGDIRPLAVVLHTDGARARTGRGSIYMRHAQTCTSPPRTNRGTTTNTRTGSNR